LWLAFFITIGTGTLMVSNILYYSFKAVDLRGKVPFVAALAIVLAFVFASIDPPKILFAVFLAYGLSGPVLYVLRRRHRGRRKTQGSTESESNASGQEQGPRDPGPDE
jgi:CDP-diacylglycerol--serine O-phosphatidyltransferase